ncbi:hypothetical protein ACFL5O_10495 [Myxococcota bacterium]
MPDLSPTGPWVEPWASDSLWRRAHLGDPLDLGRLAQREGAAGLLTAVERGGSAGVVALRALAWADDAEFPLGRLCWMATRVSPVQTAEVLRAVHGVLVRPIGQCERMGGAGLADCASVLGGLGRHPALSDHARDLATSACARLNDRGYDCH